MEMQEIYNIENNVLVGMNQPIISCYNDYLKHDYLIPENVTAIKGKNFVPFAMNKFQITKNVKKIDIKAVGQCACIKKFVVVDAETKKRFSEKGLKSTREVAKIRTLLFFRNFGNLLKDIRKI